MSKLLSLTFVSVVLVSGTACRKDPASAATTATAAAPAAAPATTAPGTPSAAQAATQPPVEVAKPVAAVPAQLPTVLAHVNGENVTRADFERLLLNIELGNRGPVPAERRDEIYRKVLDDLVNYTLLKQEAKAKNFTVTDAEVETQIQRLRQDAGTEEAFTQQLAARKMTLERLKADARIEMAIGKMMDAQVATVTEATDTDVRDFYDKNPERFTNPETVRASHILLLIPATADETTKKDARTKIEGVLKRAKSGEDFAVLAKQNSQDGSAAEGGDLGYFPREKMVKEFSDVAFALKTGEMSDVVTTQFGLHIIKVTDHKPGSTVALEEVGPKVKEFLTGQKKRQLAQAFIEQVKQKAKIEVLI